MHGQAHAGVGRINGNGNGDGDQNAQAQLSTPFALIHCRITNHHNTTDGYCPACFETFKRQAQTSAASPAATQIAA